MKKQYDIAKGERLIEEAHEAMGAASGLSRRCAELALEIRTDEAELKAACSYNWSMPTAPEFDIEALLKSPPERLDFIRFNVPKAREILAMRSKLAQLTVQRDKAGKRASQAYELAMKIKTFLETPSVR